MSNKKQFKFFIAILSVLINGIAWCNTLLNWQLFSIPTITFQALSIFLASILLWLFVAIDWTSLFTLLCLGFIPEITLVQVFQLSFGHQTFVFLLFTFIVTYALNQTPFLKRVTNYLLTTQLAQNSPFHFLVSFLSVVLLLSSFLSPTITFMFLFPLYEELAVQFGWQKGDKKASYFLIAMFSTIALGTAMTPINHVFSITAMSIYQNATQIHISTLQYMAMAVPTGLLLFGLIILSLKCLKYSHTGQMTLQTLNDLPKVTQREKWIVSIFMMMIILWVLPEMIKGLLPQVPQITLVLPPLLATIMLASVSIEDEPLVNLSQAFSQGVHWQSMLLVGATLALGAVLSNVKIGVVHVIQQLFAFSFEQVTPFVLVVIFVTWAGLQTNFTSNLVTVSFVTTILVTLHVTSINVAVLSCLIGFMSSIAVMSAPAMPYVAISIGSKWTNTKDCLTYGGFILGSTIILVSVFAYPLGTLLM